MYRSVLVPLDGSAFGEHALPYALELARRGVPSIRIVHVHVPPSALDMEGLTPYQFEGVPEYAADAEVRQEESGYLECVLRRVPEELRSRVTAEVVDGPVVPRLEAYAREAQADLVVMTTHGRTGLSRAWLGSVADGLVRRLSMPVLLLRPSGEESEEPTAGGFRHVLVALDGSRLAEQILEHAIGIGVEGETAYTLVRVVTRSTRRQEPGRLEAQEQEAQAYLDRIAGTLRMEGINVRTRVAVYAHPALGIIEEARQQGADLIALATHGRGGLVRLVLGSVADKVLRGTTLPILLYRPREG